MATTKKTSSKSARKRGRKNAAGAESLESAQARLREMIASKEREVSDGGLEIAIAIASITSLVTVDTTQDPFTVDPEDLGERTFSDPAVGISDQQMAIFKANLQRLLPQIAEDIAQIPENADLRIADVAEFVQLSLMRP